jgi:hypothetical protein
VHFDNPGRDVVNIKVEDVLSPRTASRQFARESGAFRLVDVGAVLKDK